MAILRLIVLMAVASQGGVAWARIQGAVQTGVEATVPKTESVAGYKELSAENHLLREQHLAQHIQQLDKELIAEATEVNAEYQKERKVALAAGGTTAAEFLATELGEIEKMKITAERLDEQHEDLQDGILEAAKDIEDRTAAIDDEEAEAKEAGGEDSDHRLVARQTERAEIAEATKKLNLAKAKSAATQDRTKALVQALADAEMHNKEPEKKLPGLSDGYKRANLLIRAAIEQQEEDAADLEEVTEEAEEEDATTAVSTVPAGVGHALALAGVGMLCFVAYERTKKHDRPVGEYSGLTGHAGGAAGGRSANFGSQL
jgi:hypothetical protein